MIQLDLHPGEKKLRQFGWVALVAFSLLAGLVLWKGGLFGLSFGAAATAVAGAMVALGLLSAVLSLVAPRANRFLYVGLMVLTFPIGLVVSQVVLLVVFAVFLTPLGLVFRLLGRDPLHRDFERGPGSYWRKVRHRHDPDSYFRQF